MSGKYLKACTVFVTGIVMLAGVRAYSRDRTPPIAGQQPLVVFVMMGEKKIVYSLDSDHHWRGKNKTFNWELAELKLREGADGGIIGIIDDRVPLSGIAQFSSIAMAAGYKSIRIFVYWHRNGRVAELGFGPVKKLSEDHPLQSLQ